MKIGDIITMDIDQADTDSLSLLVEHRAKILRALDDARAELTARIVRDGEITPFGLKWVSQPGRRVWSDPSAVVPVLIQAGAVNLLSPLSPKHVIEGRPDLGHDLGHLIETTPPTPTLAGQDDRRKACEQPKNLQNFG